MSKVQTCREKVNAARSNLVVIFNTGRLDDHLSSLTPHGQPSRSLLSFLVVPSPPPCNYIYINMTSFVHY
jgi:hypothetical protein